jgi:hypothetical protein
MQLKEEVALFREMMVLQAVPTFTLSKPLSSSAIGILSRPQVYKRTDFNILVYISYVLFTILDVKMYYKPQQHQFFAGKNNN